MPDHLARRSPWKRMHEGGHYWREDIIHSDTVRHDRQLGNIVAHCMNCVHTSSLFSCDHTSQASPIAQELLLADKGGIATDTVLPWIQFLGYDRQPSTRCHVEGSRIYTVGRQWSQVSTHKEVGWVLVSFATTSYEFLYAFDKFILYVCVWFYRVRTAACEALVSVASCLQLTGQPLLGYAQWEGSHLFSHLHSKTIQLSLAGIADSAAKALPRSPMGLEHLLWFLLGNIRYAFHFDLVQSIFTFDSLYVAVMARIQCCSFVYITEFDTRLWLILSKRIFMLIHTSWSVYEPHH